MDTIRQTDAILDLSDPDNPTEPEWPPAEFIIGNPPFLGHFPFREQLGDEYVNAVYFHYGSRIPNSSDLCCYWFEEGPRPDRERQDQPRWAAGDAGYPLPVQPPGAGPHQGNRRHLRRHI